jgi:hypothetical protein
MANRSFFPGKAMDKSSIIATLTIYGRRHVGSRQAGDKLEKLFALGLRDSKEVGQDVSKFSTTQNKSYKLETNRIDQGRR